MELSERARARSRQRYPCRFGRFIIYAHATRSIVSNGLFYLYDCIAHEQLARYIGRLVFVDFRD